jgi:hypothetical protein
VAQAKEEGWGHFDADKESYTAEAAAVRLRKAGCIVDLETGFVGWPNKEAARKGQLTPELMADANLIRELSSEGSSGDDAPIAVAGAL